MTDRLYYADSFLREFSAHVTDIRESSRTDGVSLWQIALDRSAFYPTSGGQPCDRGVLIAHSKSGAPLEAPIESVEEDADGTVWHYTRKPLAQGTEVEGEIDWPRRLDHIQQHSGQHLLSAVFTRELNALTVSFHLGDAISTIDLTGGPVEERDLERVERTANELIAEDRAVTVHTVEHAEAEAMLSAGQLHKLPPREGKIRLIEIEEYDLNACGGTHVCGTGQIGGLVIRSTEKVRHGLRVSFVCGLRAATTARHDFTVLTRLAGLLSAPADALPAAVERLNARTKSAEKTNHRLNEELTDYHASRLVVEEQSHDGLRVINRRFDDRDAEYVRLLAAKVTSIAPRTVALMAASANDPARILLATSREMDCHCGTLLRDILAPYGLRGGGSDSMAQTEVPLEKLDALLAELETTIRTHCVEQA